ncbi:DUF1643 domain-containing protein [Fictibacillus sp. FJAT-27399]|uniref:DUF1643 domain-containing protein n=1 Tax=Fictibacillus sp. FJAT-27399 TaxID=1729689 RepID=UPI000781F439|nr:DUF1643 domain-containing protein [Fictibacillus sp. FJAT-27399]
MVCVAYPQGFKVEDIIPGNDNDKRYLLRVSNESSSAKGIATIIMMNPSKATKSCSDPTVNKVLKFFGANLDKQIREIIILNLFPYYETDSKKLAACVKRNNSNELGENLNEFKNCIKVSNLIVLAWGDVPKGFSAKLHNKYVKSVINIIDEVMKQNSLYVFKDNRFNIEHIVTKKHRPRHPNRIALNDLQKVQRYSSYRDLLKLKFS